MAEEHYHQGLHGKSVLCRRTWYAVLQRQHQQREMAGQGLVVNTWLQVLIRRCQQADTVCVWRR